VTRIRWGEVARAGVSGIRSGPFGADFVDRLVADFRIPDRGRLIDALAGAYAAYQEEVLLGKGYYWADDEASTLDALAKNDGPLWTTVELIRRHPYPIARQLAGEEDDLGGAARFAQLDRLHELADQLAEVGRAAAAAPRRKRERGGHHPENAAIRRAVEVLAGYWIDDLGRKFKHTRRNWSNIGHVEHPRWVPKPGCRPVNFFHCVIERIAPGQEGNLRTVLQEVKSYGK
jgi:hypothetical protein